MSGVTEPVNWSRGRATGGRRGRAVPASPISRLPPSARSAAAAEVSPPPPPPLRPPVSGAVCWGGGEVEWWRLSSSTQVLLCRPRKRHAKDICWSPPTARFPLSTGHCIWKRSFRLPPFFHSTPSRSNRFWVLPSQPPVAPPDPFLSVCVSGRHGLCLCRWAPPPRAPPPCSLPLPPCTDRRQRWAHMGGGGWSTPCRSPVPPRRCW